MPSSVRFECFEVDLASGELRKNGIRIHLREQPFRALALLLERPGEVVPRDDLRRRLWPADTFVDFENNLNNAIARVREALGDSAEQPRFIETLPKRGYRFIAAVSRSTPPIDVPHPIRARLVVLPFVNLSADPAQEYFSDAMTEEIITEVAALAPEQLGVIARTTAMRYKGTPKDVGQIGRELNVDYVVEGGVRRQDDRVTITAQLVRVGDQTHLLARRYEADLADIFDVRGAIAQAMAVQIGVAPAKAAGGHAIRKPTQNMTAYNLYLQGRMLLAREAPESFTMARRCLEEAISLDPRFALAYDALAELYWYLGFFGHAPARQVSSAALSYAVKALSIDDTLAETHALLGILLKESDLDWTAVKREMDRAREINPLSPLVRVRYAIGWLLKDCQLGEAATEIEAALESDPQSTFMRAWLACVLWLDRRYDRAIDECRLMVAFDPTAFTGYWLLGLVLRDYGRYEEAIAAHRTAVELSGDSPLILGWFGLTLAQAGRTADARGILDRLTAMTASRYVPPTSFAWTHYGLGEIDQTFEWLDRAVDDLDAMIFPICSYPFLDPLREDPRFVALLRRLNFDPAKGGTCRPPAIASRINV